MAMEKQFMISDTHCRAITAIGFHPIRREIIVGFEDGIMKWWEQDTGKLMLTTNEHAGWVTDFQFWADQRLLFSSGNDGCIVVWGSGGNVVDRIKMSHPVHTMCFNLRRQQIICGFNGFIQLFSLDPQKKFGSVINKKKPYITKDHRDIVQCIICHESRLYTAGYDGKLCIYDTTLYPGTKALDLVYSNNYAHDAGITCMILVKDNENNTWLITGSFDRSVKIWSQDGQLRNKVEMIFLDTITSLCYVPRAKVVWITSASQQATLFDPKAGENVTEFLPTFNSDQEEEISHKLLKLRHNLESGQIIGSTSRRHLMVWKYNSQACITALKCKHAIESITYTRKVPILLFSGGNSGTVYKWERLQSSHFMYSVETLTRKECMDKLDAIKVELGINEKPTATTSSTGKVPNNRPISHYAYNKALVSPSSLYKKSNVTVLRCLYIEHLDLLVLACEDGNLYLWGFDYAAVAALTRLSPVKKEERLDQKYEILLESRRQFDSPTAQDTDSALNELPNDQHKRNEKEHGRLSMNNPGIESNRTLETPTTPSPDSMTKDSVTNRVAGFICVNVLLGHSNCVGAFDIVHNEDLYSSTYLISGGWDRRILIWSLDGTGSLHDRFRNTSLRSENDEEADETEELACDGVIIDLVYCRKRNEFAYASSDGMVYIREFSTDGSKMRLCNTLQGHDLEVTVVRWNDIYDKWITGSEDGTIKIWSEDGMTCERTLSTQGVVSTLCIDKVNGSIVAAVEKVCKVYDMKTFNLVQTNIGHTENIRSVVHVVERAQYVTGSWDKSIRIWNAYRRPVRRRRNKDEDTKLQAV